MDKNAIKTKTEVTAKRCNMLRTGDELRAAANERVRRCRAKQAVKGKKGVGRERIVQFIIMIRLPIISISKISR